jgi:hypothetical protein
MFGFIKNQLLNSVEEQFKKTRGRGLTIPQLKGLIANTKNDGMRQHAMKILWELGDEEKEWLREKYKYQGE